MFPSPTEFRSRILPIVGSQLVGVLCGLGGVAFISRIVPPEIYGGYSVFLSFTTLGMWLVHSGLVKAINRQWAAAPDRPALRRLVTKEWIRKWPWLALASAGGAWAVARAGGPSWLPGFGLLFLAAAALSILALAQAALQASRAHWSDFSAASTGSVTRSFLPPTLFWSSGAQILVLYAGFALHTVIAALTSWWLLARDARRQSDGSERAELRAVYLGPLFTVLALASWSLYGINRWIAAAQFGETTAGLFTLANNLASIVPTILGAMLVQYFQPILYALSEKPDRDDGYHSSLPRRSDALVLVLTVIGAAAILFLRGVAPWLVGNLVGEKYRDALPWIIPAGAFALTIATAQFYHVMLLAARRERACAVVDLSTAGLMIAAALIGSFLGAKFFGWALTATPLIPFLLTRTLARAALRTTPDGERVL